jgi:hypothetical protein
MCSHPVDRTSESYTPESGQESSDTVERLKASGKLATSSQMSAVGDSETEVQLAAMASSDAWDGVSNSDASQLADPDADDLAAWDRVSNSDAPQLANPGFVIHGLPAPEGPDDAIYCPTCEMWLNGRDQYEDHLKGKKHKKNAKRTRAERGLPATVMSNGANQPVAEIACQPERSRRCL